LVVGQVSVAVGAPAVPDPGALDHVSVIAEFPPGDQGAFAESMAPDGRGGMIVSVTTWGAADGSTSNFGQLWRVGPDGSAAEFGPRIDLSPSGMLMGVAVDEQGRVFVALNNFGSDYGMPEDPQSGVLRVTPGVARRVLTLDEQPYPNGLAVVDGTAYVTDSLGSIWSGPTAGAPAQAGRWFSSPLLDPVGPLAFGANGIAYRKGSLYVTSYSQGSIVRIPIRGNGTEGSPEVVASDPRLVGADGIGFDRSGRLWAAVNGEIDWATWSVVDPGSIVMVDTAGTVNPAEVPEGALDYPTAVLPGSGGTLFALNGSFLYGTPDVVALSP
jgi:sugar lactone lactonase YvrE